MVIFRENTEDIYAGIEFYYDTPEAKKLLNFLTDELHVNKIRFPETSSFGIKPVSKDGSERWYVLPFYMLSSMGYLLLPLCTKAIS